MKNMCTERSGKKDAWNHFTRTKQSFPPVPANKKKINKKDTEHWHYKNRPNRKKGNPKDRPTARPVWVGVCEWEKEELTATHGAKWTNVRYFRFSTFWYWYYYLLTTYGFPPHILRSGQRVEISSTRRLFYVLFCCCFQSNPSSSVYFLLISFSGPWNRTKPIFFFLSSRTGKVASFRDDRGFRRFNGAAGTVNAGGLAND